MNDDFAPFELAVKLNEKGFNEPCFGWYYPSEVCGFDYKTTIVFNNSAYRGSNYKDMLVSHKDEKHIDAPTISQVLKWLRDTHRLFVSPCVIAEYQDDFHRDTTYWSFIVVNIESGDSIYREYDRVTEKRYETYEQAALAGIEYVLNNLI